MAVTKVENLGEITSNFLLNDFSVYLMNTSATGNYVSTDWELLGFTSAEKSINPINEKYNREDKIPRVPTYSKTIRKGLEVTYDISNYNATLVSIFKQGTLTSNSTGSEIGYGTSEPALEYRAIRFASQIDNNKWYCITIPKCETTQSGEQTVGGEEETKIPLLSKAIYNPAGTVTRNIYYESFYTSTIGATATVPEGYN